MKSALRERLRANEQVPGGVTFNELRDYALLRLVDLTTARDAQFRIKLEKYERQAASDFGDRRVGGWHQHSDYGAQYVPPELRTIFDRSNLSVQIVRSVVRFLMSRIHKDMFGSKPWLAATPEGPHDEALAAQIQKHADWKLRQCSWQERARDALSTAFALGFVPMKTTWTEDWDTSDTLQSVLANGDQPVLANGADFIVPEDDTQEAATGGEMGEPMGMDAGEGEATPPPAPPRVFAKDPSIPAPDAQNGLAFKEHLIEEPTSLYKGLDFATLNWRDAGWPVNARDVSLSSPDCDFIWTSSDRTWEQLRMQFNADGSNEEVQATLERLRSAPAVPQSEGAKPKEEHGEAEVRGSDPKNPIFKVTECYFRKRVLKDGPESRIFMVVIGQYREVLWVEYLAAISPRAQAPLQVMAVNKLDGRAYGRGFYEYFEMAAEAIDRLINGVLVRNEYHCNPIKLIDAKAFAELSPADKVIQVGPGLWMTMETKGVPIQQLLQVLELPDLDQRSWQLLEMFMQLIQVESGVTNANQGDLSNLPSNGTATGVNSLLESSSVLHQFVLEEAKSGLQSALRYAVELLYFRQDADETFEYMEGDSAALQELAQAEQVVKDGEQPMAQPGTMTLQQAQALANIPMNVQILLSKGKAEEMAQAAEAALPYMEKFIAYPPSIQLQFRPIFVQILRGLKLDNADKALPSPSAIQQAIELQAQAEAAAAAAQGGIVPMDGGQQSQLPPNVIPDQRAA